MDMVLMPILSTHGGGSFDLIFCDPRSGPKDPVAKLIRHEVTFGHVTIKHSSNFHRDSGDLVGLGTMTMAGLSGSDNGKAGAKQVA